MSFEVLYQCRDSPLFVLKIGCGLTALRIVVQFPVGPRDLSVLQYVQIRSGGSARPLSSLQDNLFSDLQTLSPVMKGLCC